MRVIGATQHRCDGSSGQLGITAHRPTGGWHRDCQETLPKAAKTGTRSRGHQARAVDRISLARPAATQTSTILRATRRVTGSQQPRRSGW